MKIHVTIDPYLLQYIPRSVRPAGSGEREVNEGTTVGQIVTMLSFSDGAEILTIVNEVCCLEKDRLMKDGDSLLLLPLIAGG
jgi:hypothetical protein